MEIDDSKKQEIERLIELLKSDDFETYRKAEEALLELGVAIVPALIELVAGDITHRLEERAFRMIWAIGKPAVPLLLEIIQNIESSQRVWAIALLGVINDKRAIPILMELLNDPDHNLRNQAINALRDIKATIAVEPIIDILNQADDGYTQRCAVVALGFLKDKRAFEVILRLQSTTNDDKLREAAIWTLGEIGDKRAVKPLKTILRYKTIPDTDDVYETTAQAIAKINEKNSLSRLLNDLYHRLKETCKLAIRLVKTLRY